MKTRYIIILLFVWLLNESHGQTIGILMPSSTDTTQIDTVKLNIVDYTNLMMWSFGYWEGVRLHNKGQTLQQVHNYNEGRDSVFCIAAVLGWREAEKGIDKNDRKAKRRMFDLFRKYVYLITDG